MDDKGKYISDDDFRVIGHADASPAPPRKNSRRTLTVSIVLLALALGIGLPAYFLWPKPIIEDPHDGLFENTPETVRPQTTESTFGIETDLSFTEKIDTVINDVQLAIYIPHNATPELTLGVPDRNDNGIILALQAADIRKDNRKILGAFVLKGEPLAWGISKKGYCAIIDGKVTIGVSENSPLFEEATEKGGYFFRQYPLVDNGVLVENEPKNKSMRKALCTRSGQIFVAVSETDESFHDFAQALVDLGVENAIYLVGSHFSFGWYIDASGDKTLFAPDMHRETYKNESYIVWR